jgi:membrane fusion protein, multidrug efflux system
MSQSDESILHPLIPKVPPRDSLRQARRFGAILLGILTIGGGLRLAFNYRDAQALQQYTAASAEHTVATVKARQGELKRNLVLPATLRGSNETVVYARSAGYLKAWYKTIGEHVEKGQLLAVVDAPEQEQELAQARAVREQIKVRLALAKQTEARWETLRQSDSVAAQDVEEKRSARALAEADLAAADASVKRLEQLEGFRRIVAPYAGVVTRRSAEVGNLISAGGKELFAITQTDSLRLTVWVPQTYASDIKPGQEVGIKIAEYPGKKFAASVENVAGAIDPVNRSRQVDLVLPNPDGKLLPGTYVEVAISLSSGVNALVVPANVLVMGQEGPRIATVDHDSRLNFKSVRLGRDLGRQVEILDGIDPGDTLVQSPSDALVEGEKVVTREISGKAEKDEKGSKVSKGKEAT